MKNLQQFIEEKCKEFEEKFVHKGEDGDNPPEKWAWTIMGSYSIEVKSFLRQALTECSHATADVMRGKSEMRYHDNSKEDKIKMGCNSALSSISSKEQDWFKG